MSINDLFPRPKINIDDLFPKTSMGVDLIAREKEIADLENRAEIEYHYLQNSDQKHKVRYRLRYKILKKQLLELKLNILLK